MTWRSRHSSIHRSIHRSPKPSLPSPNLKLCKQIESEIAPYQTDLDRISDQIAVYETASLWIAPSGKIYGKTEWDHLDLSKRASSAFKDPNNIFQDAGFLRVYLSEHNDLSFKVKTDLTRQQKYAMDDLNSVFHHRNVLIFVDQSKPGTQYADQEFDSIGSFRKAYP